MDDHGRSSRRGLSAARIYGAALGIIDAEGLPALNMRRLGAELGVDAMALYRYLPSKQAVLDGVVDLVLEGLGHGSGGDAPSQCRTFFTELHAALAAHPNAIPLVAAAGLTKGQAQARVGDLLQSLAAAGLDAGQALDAFSALESLTLGYAWLEVAGFVGELPDSEPFVRQAVSPDASSLAQEYQARFERCLDPILESLLALPAAGRGAARG